MRTDPASHPDDAGPGVEPLTGAQIAVLVVVLLAIAALLTLLALSGHPTAAVIVGLGLAVAGAVVLIAEDHYWSAR